MKTLVFLTACAAMLVADNADGQRRRAVGGRHVAGGRNVVIGGGGWGGYDGYRASTAFEGATRGMAELVRAHGEANINNAIAAQERQEAYSRYLDNRQKTVDAYFQRRRSNAAYRAEEQQKRNDSVQAYLSLPQNQPNQRPSSSQLDPITGTITWPIILKASAYDQYREPLEQIFASRAARGITGDEYQQVVRITKAWRAEIIMNKTMYSNADYLEAVRLVQRLASEAKLGSQ